MQKALKKALWRFSTKRLKRTRSDPRFFNKIKNFINYNNYNYKKQEDMHQLKKYKVNFTDLFFYLAKKVGFRKYKNSFTLNAKWTLLLKYLKVFNNIKFYKQKFNIKAFFYTVSLYIYASRRRRSFNFKKSIYINLYVTIAKKFFTGSLKLVTSYMKLLINILCSKIQYKNIFFVYYFMTNQNVTSQLISRYIALKLKKNFTLLKTLNPLHRELARLSKNSRTSQKAYKYYNYNVLFRRAKKRLKIKIRKYLRRYRHLFKINNYSYYVKNWFFIYFNTFYYHKYFSYHHCSCSKIYLTQKKIYKIKYLIFKKVFFINTYYNLILNLYKGKKIKFKNNILVLNLIKVFNIFLPLKYKKLLKSKTKLVNVSSYFYKNLINFKLVQFIWEKFNKFNYRNVRQQYKPKYKSILMGYKMAFRGRFSRKQRASFVWTQVGKAPLNTLNINIDYTFFTIPLKNSIISIKIWLYKIKSYARFKYYLKV